MNETALEEFKQSVEAQTQALLNALRSVAQGNLDVDIPVLPEGEGIQPLAELAGFLQSMIDDFRAMVAEQAEARVETEQSQRKLQTALEELLAVQRRYLREHWEQYSMAVGARGYYRFGDEEGPTAETWLPAMAEAVRRTETVIESEQETALAIPLELYGEVIGVLGFSRDDAEPWDEEEIAAAKAIAGEVAEALDKQRLFDETQQALVETEQMYQASAELAEAQTFDDVLDTLRAHTLLGRADYSASLSLFDRPWEESNAPEWVVPIARWGSATSASIPRFALRELASDLLHPDKPTIIADTQTDPRINESTRAVIAGSHGVRSTIVVPLAVGGRWIGYLDALFTGHTEFSETEVRRLVALADQASIVLQNLRQLEDMRSRARRERVLREITARMRTLADPETLAQTAVRELGTALGRPVFIRLGGAADLTDPHAVLAAEDGDQKAGRVDRDQAVPAEGVN
ncbi:MAG TPA: GAF domain-containing protein [Anaerolineae bacterium]|nr:GAF domain-containing protein [Anaerolineae bacterium]